MNKDLLIISLALSFMFFSVPSLVEADCTDEIAGTYLVQDNNGDQRLWTFTQDGTILGTSSVEPKFSFSNQQGDWEASGNNGVAAVIMNFGFDKDNNLSYIGRLTATLKFDDNCRTFAGTYVLRKFQPPENPMKPETDTDEPITDTFKGQRISAK